MASRSGDTYVARALKAAGVDTVFFLMGGPMVGATMACRQEGMALVDVRHEQASAMMAHAYSRVTGRPGVCIASSGPAVANLVTGIYNAYYDACPVVALGGAAPIFEQGRGAFQELDQVSLMKPITKWAERVTHTERIPEMIAAAFRYATSGRPGPVYLDFPGDILSGRAEEDDLYFPLPSQFCGRSSSQADPESVVSAIELLRNAERPIVIAGTGVWWSQASEELREFVELTGIPCYTTPLGRGAIPDDHPLAFPAARTLAFNDADFILVAGSRFSFILSYGTSPRFHHQAKTVMIDIESSDVGKNRPVDVALIGDARAVLRQLAQAAREHLGKKDWGGWERTLQASHEEKVQAMESVLYSDSVPIHPMRLFREVDECIPRESIVVADGNETLLHSRRAVSTYYPGHRLDEGPAACIGVGVPFGVGAKAGRPDRPVIVLSGDGGFGMNGMEMDTAVRNNLPIVVVVNNNGGWAGAVEDDRVPGQNLGFPRYDRIAETLGAHAEFVQTPEEIRPALERALSSGKAACVNVITDPRVRAHTLPFYSIKRMSVLPASTR